MILEVNTFMLVRKRACTVRAMVFHLITYNSWSVQHETIQAASAFPDTPLATNRFARPRFRLFFFLCGKPRARPVFHSFRTPTDGRIDSHCSSALSPQSLMVVVVDLDVS